MRTFTYVVLGVIGTIAYQRVSEHQTQLTKEMRRMMKHNHKSMRKIREIF